MTYIIQVYFFRVCTCNINTTILTQFVQYPNIDQITLYAEISPKKLYIGSGSWVTPRSKPETKINLGLDSVFNSIHFGKKNQQMFEIFNTHTFWV
jgi:hypothetical protein